MPPPPAPPPPDAPPAGAPVSVREHAPDSVSTNYKVDWSALDKNGDGSVSRSEVRASGNGVAYAGRVRVEAGRVATLKLRQSDLNREIRR